jgi:cadmium resistance protein CadD (predicted permease)
LADLGVATVAFVGTNMDNTLVAMALVAGAPPERAHRIAAGQVIGSAVLVAVAVGAALVLFEFSPHVVGLIGLVPLAMGLRGLVGLRSQASRADQEQRVAHRAVGRSLTAATLVTIGLGGDNLAAYIPLFRVGGGSKVTAFSLVFVLGEIVVTWLVLTAGRHPKARAVMTRLGALAVPLLLCVIGVLVMVEAGTFSLL